MEDNEHIKKASYVRREVEFIDSWYSESHNTAIPSFADAIEWAEERQRKRDVGKACEWVTKTFSDCNGRVDCITEELIQSLTDYMMEE